MNIDPNMETKNDQKEGKGIDVISFNASILEMKAHEMWVHEPTSTGTLSVVEVARRRLKEWLYLGPVWQTYYVARVMFMESNLSTDEVSDAHIIAASPSFCVSPDRRQIYNHEMASNSSKEWAKLSKSERQYWCDKAQSPSEIETWYSQIPQGYDRFSAACAALLEADSVPSEYRQEIANDLWNFMSIEEQLEWNKIMTHESSPKSDGASNLAGYNHFLSTFTALIEPDEVPVLAKYPREAISALWNLSSDKEKLEWNKAVRHNKWCFQHHFDISFVRTL